MKQILSITSISALMFCRSIVAFMVGTILAASAQADVVLKQRNEKIYFAHILNTITKSDYTALVEKVGAIKGATIFYVLNSTGGSIETSLQIGRFIRNRKALAFVEEDAVCLSSCVFILAGAARRHILGRVGIHRPYEPNDNNVSSEAQKVKYKKLGNAVRSYLSEMNVQSKLYDDMLYIPPEKMKILSDEDLSGYGLVDHDPFQDEADAAKNAKTFGVSRQEYAKRMARIRNECPRLAESSSYEEQQVYFGCYDDIERGRK